MNYFPPYRHTKNKSEVQIDLSNYATKSDSRSATGVVYITYYQIRNYSN